MRLAILPHAGGSKRIPRKNVRPFCGRPMIVWPLAAARESGLFDRILVSTDDADIAGGLGGEAPFLRPATLSEDHTGTLEVIAHATRWAQSQGWLFPEHFATRSQDLPRALHDAAQFYWGRPEAWLAAETLFGAARGP